MIYQLKAINSIFCRTPSALAGLALGIASLGLCLENITLLQGIAQPFAALLASCLLLPLFSKFLFNPELLKEDLQHPLSASLSPIIAMATMVVILATPASLLLLGYLSATIQPNYMLLCLLAGIAILMTVTVYTQTT